MTSDSLMARARAEFHRHLLEHGILGLRNGVPTLADKDSKTSVKIAVGVVNLLAAKCGCPARSTNLAGQTLGQRFTMATCAYLQNTFDRLQPIRPGRWRYTTESDITRFEQYRHLAQLDAAAKQSPTLRSILGADYIITPDIVISREPMDDAEFPGGPALIHSADVAARGTPLRQQNGGGPLLVASVSCKWTMRSDRAQNTRTEALNLIRHRKGRTPAIVAVTAEPMPTRLASLALGTGDIDKVYHFALYELLQALQDAQLEDQASLLDDMVQAQRLADVSDLPFDLAI